MNMERQEAELGDEEGLTSYEQIWSNIILTGEVVCTVAPEDVISLKTGIKNIKSRQAADHKSLELPPVTGTLSFLETPSNTIEGAIEVTITLSQKGSIKILGMRIPETDM